MGADWRLPGNHVSLARQTSEILAISEVWSTNPFSCYVNFRTRRLGSADQTRSNALFPRGRFGCTAQEGRTVGSPLPAIHVRVTPITRADSARVAQRLFGASAPDIQPGIANPHCAARLFPCHRAVSNARVPPRATRVFVSDLKTREMYAILFSNDARFPSCQPLLPVGANSCAVARQDVLVRPSAITYLSCSLSARMGLARLIPPLSMHSFLLRALQPSPPARAILTRARSCRSRSNLAEGGDLRYTAGFRLLDHSYLSSHISKGGIRERPVGKRAPGSRLTLVPRGAQEKDDQEKSRPKEKGAGEEKDRKKSPSPQESGSSGSRDARAGARVAPGDAPADAARAATPSASSGRK